MSDENLGHDRATDPTRRRDLLRLARSENVGPAAFRALLSRFGAPAAALEAAPALAARGGARKRVTLCSTAAADAEIAAGEALGARLVFVGDPAYPALLAAVDPPPPALWTLGPALDILDDRCVAIVGARNASSVGGRFAAWIAEEAVSAGFTIVSGLARGVDAAAHGGALRAAAGRTDAPTVAVVAGGVDHLYPPQNAALRAEIAEKGCLISEMPIGFQPTNRHFPRRNRLISGLSRGVLVVEAAKRSGSLITARQALEQGRDVMAVPGHPFDPRAAGANALLRDGAVLIRDAADLVETLSPSFLRRAPMQAGLFDGVAPHAPPPAEAEDGPSAAAATPQSPEPASDGARDALLRALSLTPTAVDDLLRDAKVDAADGLAALLELELAGLAVRDVGGEVRRAPDARARRD